jgi:hypothetical protein
MLLPPLLNQEGYTLTEPPLRFLERVESNPEHFPVKLLITPKGLWLPRAARVLCGVGLPRVLPVIIRLEILVLVFSLLSPSFPLSYLE